MYLSIPLHFAKALNFDTNLVVRLSPIFMNSLIQAFGDYYLVKLTGADEVANVALTYALSNKIINLVF